METLIKLKGLRQFDTLNLNCFKLGIPCSLHVLETIYLKIEVKRDCISHYQWQQTTPIPLNLTAEPGAEMMVYSGDPRFKALNVQSEHT